MALSISRRATYLDDEDVTTLALAAAPVRGYHRPRANRLAGGQSMPLQDRIEALREKHASLERAIDEEIHHPFPNQEAISDLKRQKLRIKDEIFQLERQ